MTNTSSQAGKYESDETGVVPTPRSASLNPTGHKEYKKRATPSVWGVEKRKGNRCSKRAYARAGDGDGGML